MIDLNKAFELENGIKVGGVIIPDSVVQTTRSSKPTIDGNDFVTSIEYYNSLTQINANRIAKSDFTYTGDLLTSQVNTYYETDGTTVHYTETLTYTYSGDVLTNIEVS